MNNDLKNVSYIDQDVLFFHLKTCFYHSFHLYFKKSSIIVLLPILSGSFSLLFQIKVRPTVREVVAIYTIDEGSTEIVIQLPSNFPLGPVSVDSSKRVGVTAAQWRTWILQLTTFLQVCMAKVLETKCTVSVLQD